MAIFKKKNKDTAAMPSGAGNTAKKERAGLSVLKQNQFILSVMAVVLGVCFLIWPVESLIILVRIIGIVFIVTGAVAVIIFFTNREKALMHSFALGVGVVMAVIGVWIEISPEFLITLMPRIIGLILLVCGITSFMGTVTMAKNEYKRWWVSLLLSIGILAAAIILLIRSFDVAQLFMRICGALFIYTGAVNIWIFIKLRKYIKAAAAKYDAIEVHGEIIDEVPADRPGD